MLVAAFVFFCIGVSLARPARRTAYLLHEKRDFVPEAWEHSHKPSPSNVLPMRFGLAQSNTHRLEDFLMEVAHPSSPSYGQHWSAAKIAETFAPSPATIEAVRTWLEAEGITRERTKLSAGKSWLDVNITIEEAEDLLDTEYHVYKHGSGKEHVACNSYSIPEYLKPHIELITPTVNFDFRRPIPNYGGMRKRRRNENKSVPGVAHRLGQPGVGKPLKSKGPAGDISGIVNDLSTCDQMITPDCLRALYNVNYTPVATDINTFGIVEYTPQAFLPADLDMFAEVFATNRIGERPSLISIDGGTAQNQSQSFDFNGESDLDLEYAMAISVSQPITLYQTGDIPEGASFNNLLDALDGSYCTFDGGDDPTQDGIYPDPLPGGFKGPESCGIATPANVISTSFASDEADMTSFYSIRQCNEYGKLGLMGVTILYSSGDEGVAGNNNNCLNPDGSQTQNGTRFNPLFPAVCPFVTAVGATQVNPGASVTDPESACMQVIFSGGGFSNVFARPAYQEAAVTSFLTNFPPPFTSDQFNTSASRGFPDLSANGANYVVAIDGVFELVFGTSASSPVVGAILTLINDARLSQGKNPIGFINPTIYSDAFQAAFNDITTGTNPGCGTNGFNATPGWDPVTGLGTPNFQKLLDAWLALP